MSIFFCLFICLFATTAGIAVAGYIGFCNITIASKYARTYLSFQTIVISTISLLMYPLFLSYINELRPKSKSCEHEHRTGQESELANEWLKNKYMPK